MGSLKIGSSSTTTRIGVSSSSSVLTGIYKPFKYSCDVSETSKRRQRRRLFLGATIGEDRSRFIFFVAMGSGERSATMGS